MFSWIHNYDVFLFDFDGLLVNTEEIHYQAYKRMCLQQGFDLDWDFRRYMQAAHYSSEGLRKQIYEKFPKLEEKEPHWDHLYREKTRLYIQLLKEGAVQLMPGVEELLLTLKKWDKKRGVVTHSSNELVRIIRDVNPILNSIPHWITREDYGNPKPDSECYRVAVQKLANHGEKVVGFEDTPRGLQALMGIEADFILVTEYEYPELKEFVRKGVKHAASMSELIEHFDEM